MMQDNKRCTLEDVARVAGVSVPTVSRVLSDFPRIAAETRRRVEAAMTALHYVPVERKERKIKPGTVGFPEGITHGKVMFLVPDYQDIAVKTSLTFQLTGGIASVLTPLGIELVLGRLKSADELPDGFHTGNIDGVICKNWPKSPVVVEAIRKIPHVWCLASPVQPGLGDQVFLDSMIAAHYAADFMEQRHFRKLLLFSALIELPQYNRAMALKQICAERGMPLEIVDYPTSSVAVEQLKIETGTGIVMDSADFNLASVYIQLLRRKLHLHHDVELLAMNISREQLDSIDPTLSRLELNLTGIGQAAAEMLLWRKNHPQEPTRRLMLVPGPDYR